MTITAEAAPKCMAPESLVRFDAPLPKFSAAIANDQPVRIIALGSSSTQGVGASNPKACYPVRLQTELRERFPGANITVENLGIGGQLATDMLPRIKRDVVPRKPTLVIWQTGVNDALRRVNVDKFRDTVMAGVEELQQSGIDVMLLDMQYFPRAEKVRDYPRFLVTMRQIAKERHIPILQRFAIMKHLISTAQFTPQQLLAKDLFHPNDVSYGCLGRLMADALQGEADGVAKSTVAKSKKKYPAEPAKQAGAALKQVPVH